MDEMLTLAKTGQWELIREKTAGCRDYDMGRAMEAEADLLEERMGRFMPVLNTMITVAPQNR